MSAAFAAFATIAYLKAHPSDRSTQWNWFALAWVLTLASMLGKPAAVALPVAFLMLDVYPLRRFNRREKDAVSGGTAGVWLEKIPFVTLIVVFSALAYEAKSNARSVSIPTWSRLGAQVGQASYAALFYPAKTVWPTNLCASYPLPRSMDWHDSTFLLAMLGLTAVTLAILLVRNRYTGLAVAWSTYLAVTAPTLGLFRFNARIAADRYSYFGTVPLFAVLSGLILRAIWPRRFRVVALSAVSLLAWSLIGTEVALFLAAIADLA